MKRMKLFDDEREERESMMPRAGRNNRCLILHLVAKGLVLEQFDKIGNRQVFSIYTSL